MKTSANTLMIAAAALIVAAGAYWYFFTGNSNSPALTQVGGGGSAAQAQFQTLVGELSPITFDTSIFSDPRFNALTDLATPVSPEPVGRTDPFATLSGISAK